jgi:CRP-like cAMP-binding protein
MSGIRSQLDELAKTDPDPTVRETAAAALEGDKPMKTLDTLSLMERILFLKRVPLFANLPPAEVKQVAAIAHEHLFVDGESIAEQGESGDELYVIVSGQVRVVVTASGEEETELALRGTGEYVGEMAVISQKPRMAKLVAVGEVRALCIEQKQFEGILRERPDTSLAVMQVLCDRLRERENAAQ